MADTMQQADTNAAGSLMNATCLTVPLAASRRSPRTPSSKIIIHHAAGAPHAPKRQATPKLRAALAIPQPIFPSFSQVNVVQCPSPGHFTDEDSLAAAVKHVVAADPLLADLAEAHGLPLKLLANPSCTIFSALVKSIVFQQLHGKAATTIHNRVLDACKVVPDVDLLTPQAVQACTAEALRACGLSGRKLECITLLAQHFIEERLEDATLRALPQDDLVAYLTKFKGIGVWTVDMVSMFTLGRADVLPTSDLAVRKGMKALYKLSELPSPAKMVSQAEKWVPYRSIGTFLMWRVPTTPEKRIKVAGKRKVAIAEATEQ